MDIPFFCSLLYLPVHYQGCYNVKLFCVTQVKDVSRIIWVVIVALGCFGLQTHSIFLGCNNTLLNHIYVANNYDLE